jgi:hypothetical protein
MSRYHLVGITLAAFLSLLNMEVGVSAGERSRSGKYQGRKTSGTWQQKTHRTRGHMDRSTTWQNERGQGSRTTQRNWNMFLCERVGCVLTVR